MSRRRVARGSRYAGPVRRRAGTVLDGALASRSPVESRLDEASVGLSEADRRLLFELVLGSLRWLRRLDWILERAAGRAFRRVEPALRSPLRLAAYQLLFLDRIPSYAVVDEAVGEARRRRGARAAGFANAVLRRLAEKRSLTEWPVDGSDEIETYGIESSHPDFLVRRWMAQYGKGRTAQLLAANNEPKPIHLLCMSDREAVAEALRTEGVETSRQVMSPVGLEVRSGNPLATTEFSAGRIYLQDDASQAAALVPPPRRGERILDVAASPGGKSFALAAAEPRIELVAADVSLARLETLRSNRMRLGTPMGLVAADAGRPALRSGFDRVICDLPCSGTGTIARHPEIKWRLDPQRIARLATGNRGLIKASADLVAEGGILCIITCSLEAEENEMLVGDYLESDPRFIPAALEGELPRAMDGGVEDGFRWRALTTARHDGFTVHVVRRRVGV